MRKSWVIPEIIILINIKVVLATIDMRTHQTEIAKVIIV